MEIFLYFFSNTLAFIVGLIMSFIIGISPYIIPNKVPPDAVAVGVLLFIVLSICTLLSFSSDLKYFKEDRFEIKGRLFENRSSKADIKRLKDLSLSEFKMSLESIFNQKTPKYIYSESYLIENLALVLSLALLTIQTDNYPSDLKKKINELTNFLKRYSQKSIYQIDIETLYKIKKDFNLIIELHLNN